MKKLLIISLTGLLFFSGCSKKGDDETSKQTKKRNEPSQEVTKTEPIYSNISFMTGVPVENQSSQHFSIMIENTPDARPQTGLVDADMVYEITVEGRITRYLAFFNDQIPATIGPVRSSRHYFIPLAEEMNFPYIHFGGSSFAYNALKKVAIPHIDGITQGKYFFRDRSRVAPHNAYLKTNSLSSYGSIQKPYDRYRFNNTVPSSDKKSSDITITFNNFTHVNYKYDEHSKTYLRFQEGKPHVDRISNKQIFANNVILQFAKHTAINGDKSGRINVELVGEGDIVYFTNGNVYKGHWKKVSGGLTQFYNEQNELITLSPGKTWIEVVNKDIKMGY